MTPIFDWPQIRAVYSVEGDTAMPEGGLRVGNSSFHMAKGRFSERAFSQTDAEMFDAQFCPFQPLDQPPVFALVTTKHIVVGTMKPQPVPKDTTPYAIRTIIYDADLDSCNCCCAWALDGDDNPVICVAGTSAVIKVYAPDGVLVRTLVGHGGEINALQTSPANPHIIASASADVTMRLWNLSGPFKEKPCVCIYGGDTHCDDLLAMAFHKTGRWLLSTGKDMVIALWVVPTLPGAPEPAIKQILAPQFASSEIHNAIIDCHSVAFWGDLIVSRDCYEGGQIMVWQIEGFSSANPLPVDTIAPFSHEPNAFSRSAFATSGHNNTGPFLWRHLFKLAAPPCDTQFYMRFGIHTASPDENHHAPEGLLGFCDAHSQTSFWSFRDIIEYCDYVRELHEAVEEKARCEADGTPWAPKVADLPLGVEPPLFLEVDEEMLSPKAKSGSESRRKRKDDACTDGLNEDRVGFLEQFFPRDVVLRWESMYDISNPLRPLQPHWQCGVAGNPRVGRQVAWSPSGEWCIVSLNRNTAFFMERVPVESDGDEEEGS
ncbi:hypothetical protein BROUX41_004536 [Berkeleyomyces rouxiae]|uniref:uncharacterized protein n=1 Tax=Berkeleyomyces rouxiae TaxID=2035830 RepID=UPI003B762BDF